MISSTYERVTASRDITEYEHKADLNEECYQLLSVFTTLPQYKAVSFSYSKDIYNHLDNEPEECKELILLNKIKKIIVDHDGGVQAT